MIEIRKRQKLIKAVKNILLMFGLIFFAGLFRCSTYNPAKPVGGTAPEISDLFAPSVVYNSVVRCWLKIIFHWDTPKITEGRRKILKSHFLLLFENWFEEFEKSSILGLFLSHMVRIRRISLLSVEYFF